MKKRSKSVIPVLLFLALTLVMVGSIHGATPMVSAGDSHSVALKSDGTVWTWGLNGQGQLGDGTYGSSSVPVAVPGFSGAVLVAAGNNHTLVLKSDGTVWASGDNGFGELGDGSLVDQKLPVQASGLSDVIQIAAGRWNHCMALKSDGTVWTWGGNSFGQLGIGDQAVTHADVPVQVPGLSGVVKIAAGSFHSVALKSDGTVWVWGGNNHGQLGNGDMEDQFSPVAVWNILTDVADIGVGRFHNIALGSDGTVWAWGSNQNFELGNGTTTASIIPKPVSNISDVKSIATDMHSVIVFKNDGSAWGWGANLSQQMMDDPYGTNNYITTPAALTRFDQAISITIGGESSSPALPYSTSGFVIAVKPDGSVWGWGENNNGQLGDGTIDDSPSGTRVTDVYSQTGFLDLIPSQSTGTSATWYLDADGDGYGDPGVYLDAASQPMGYVSGNTDCDDTDDTVYPGASESVADGIDNDCDGSVDEDAAGQPGQIEQISILSPSDKETIGYGASNGTVTFSFSKITGAAKYILHLKLIDMLTDMEIVIPIELIPAGTSDGNPFGGNTAATPGFSETVIGMTYELCLDSATWDVMALYDIQWGVETYDNSGAVTGSTYSGSTASQYVYGLKFLASNAITMTSPTNGSALTKTDAAPTFQWDTYQGVNSYTLILAHVGSLGFDTVIAQDNLTLNLFPMDDTTWQTMPAGTWYWTVFGYDSIGAQTPKDFTIFDFEVQ